MARRSSRLSLRSCANSSRSSPLNSSLRLPASASARRTHRRRISELTPRSRATWVIGRPDSKTRRAPRQAAHRGTSSVVAWLGRISIPPDKILVSESPSNPAWLSYWRPTSGQGSRRASPSPSPRCGQARARRGARLYSWSPRRRDAPAAHRIAFAGTPNRNEPTMKPAPQQACMTTSTAATASRSGGGSS